MKHVGAAGLFTDIPDSDYHQDPAPEPSLSSSLARVLIDQSPLHARHAHPRLNPAWLPSESTNEQAFGSAVHAILLEGEAGVKRIAVIDADSYRTKEAKEQRDEARRLHRIPLLADHFVRATNVAAAARKKLACTELRGVLDDGDAECSLFWRESPSWSEGANDRTWSRARPDWLSKDRKLVLDLKTRSNTAQPDAMVRAIASEGYALQAALYVRGVKAVTGVEPKFIFVCTEIEPPYGLSLIGLTPMAMQLADRMIQSCIDTWANCLATNVWPAYPEKICWADLPPWMEAQWVAKELH